MGLSQNLNRLSEEKFFFNSIPREILNVLFISIISILLGFQVLVFFVLIFRHFPVTSTLSAVILRDWAHLVQPEREIFFYRLLIILVCIFQILFVLLFQRHIGSADLFKRLYRYTLVELLSTATIAWTLFKIVVYGENLMLRYFLYGSLVFSGIIKVFWFKIDGLVYSFYVWLSSEDHIPIVEKFFDIFIPIFIIFTVYIPDRTGILAKIFAVDNLFAMDADLVAPAWAFFKGCLLNVEIESRYGMGMPILAATFCKMLGHFSYENIYLFINLMTMVYLVACYYFLRYWLSDVLLAVVGIVFILRFKFDFLIGMIIHPGGSALRHFFDIFFFYFLWLHLNKQRFRYLLIAIVMTALAFFGMVDSGVYQSLTLYCYLVLLLMMPATRQLFFKFGKQRSSILYQLAWYLSSFILPLGLAGFLLGYFSGNHFIQFLQNTFAFSALFRQGFSNNPIWENIGNVIPFWTGILIPTIYLLTVCLVGTRCYRQSLNYENLLVIMFAIYGLLSWNYYICRAYWGSLIYFCIPFIFVCCYWVDQMLKFVEPSTRKNILFAMLVMAVFILVTADNFIKSPNIFNITRDDMVKDKQSMQEKFISLQDTQLITQFTGPEEKVCLISSFDTALLISANRKPFFYYSPLLQNAPANTPNFYAMNLFTKTRFEQTLNELKKARPQYVFMEKKIYERKIREHAPYMFEPMFLLQERYFNNYTLITAGKHLLVLRKNEQF